MSIAVAKPIVLAEPKPALVTATVLSDVSIEGAISRVDRRGKALYTFEGTGLKKVGRGEVASVTVNGTTYRGELVAISPGRAILHISGSRSDHSIVRA